MPVQSNAALAASPTFADVVIQWEISCELEVVNHWDSPDPLSMTSWFSKWDPWMINTAHDQRYMQWTTNNYYMIGRLMDPLDGASTVNRTYPGVNATTRSITREGQWSPTEEQPNEEETPKVKKRVKLF